MKRLLILAWFYCCFVKLDLGAFERVFGPMDFHDCRVCDFALFYCGFLMVLVCLGGLKGWNVDPRGGF